MNFFRKMGAAAIGIGISMATGDPGTAIAMITGHGGKEAGNSSLTGTAPLGKALGPVGAIAGAIAYQAITGDPEGTQTLMETAGPSAAKAVFLHTVAKNGIQLSGHYLRRWFS